MANIIIVLNVKYVILESTIVHQLGICSKCSGKKLSAPPPHLPDVAKNVLALFAIEHVSEITWKTVCVTIQSHVTPAVSGSSVQCLITYAIYPIVVIVLNLSNQITSVLLR